MLKGVPIILPDLLMIMEDLVKLNLPSSLLFISLNSTIALLSLKVDAEEYLLSITRFGNGYAGVKIDSTNWVFVDKRMNIISEEYEEVKPFNENYAAIKKDNLWGYIDTTFQVKIPCKYDNCSSFKKGLASFEIKREALMIEGYINKRGEVVWQKEYSNWD